jgi:integrase
MAILVRCFECKSDLKLGTRICRKCGATLAKNKKYRVIVVHPLTRKRKSKLVDTLALAKTVDRRIRNEFENDLINGEVKQPPKPVMPISEVWDEYAAWAKTHKKSYLDDISRWTHHVQDKVAGKRMDEIITNDVQKIVDNLSRKHNVGLDEINDERIRESDERWAKENPGMKRPNRRRSTSKNLTKKTKPKKLAPATVKHVVVLIRRVYNWANEQGLYVGPNPATRVDVPKFNNEITECLTPDQIESLLKTLDGWKNQLGALVVKFSLITGFRQDEILGLEWKDVYLNKRYVDLRDPKGKPTKLPSGGEALKILHKAKELQPYEGCPYVFPNNEGERRVSFYKIWSGIRAAAKLPKKFRFHGLRHTYASYLASSGEVDLYTLQRLLNHQTPQMTQRYAHLQDKVLKKAASVADKVFVIKNPTDNSIGNESHPD